MEFRQLLPAPATVQLDDLLAAVAPGCPEARERPYVLVNFISTVDGRTTFRGRSGQLGDEGDRAMFHGLRELADAVMVGTRTLAIERYGRMLSRPERRERRLRSGRSAEPLACILTRSGKLPADIPLFGEPEARIVVFGPQHMSAPPAAAQVELHRLGAAELTPSGALQRLAAAHDVRLLLCEGGPTLFASLLAESLVDELFLTLASKLAGGGAELPLTHGHELPEPISLAPLWLLERAGALYLRYAVRAGTLD